MDDFQNLPIWMKAIPVALATAIGLVGAATASKLVVILGIPAGFVGGFAIIALLTRGK